MDETVGVFRAGEEVFVEEGGLLHEGDCLFAQEGAVAGVEVVVVEGVRGPAGAGRPEREAPFRAEVVGRAVAALMRRDDDAARGEEAAGVFAVSGEVPAVECEEALQRLG